MPVDFAAFSASVPWNTGTVVRFAPLPMGMFQTESEAKGHSQGSRVPAYCSAGDPSASVTETVSLSEMPL